MRKGRDGVHGQEAPIDQAGQNGRERSPTRRWSPLGPEQPRRRLEHLSFPRPAPLRVPCDSSDLTHRFLPALRTPPDFFDAKLLTWVRSLAVDLKL